MLRPSNNFDAEVLGKGLGAKVSGPPGTIAKGAAAIARWVADQGASSFRSYDSSGLSYRDRVTTAGIVHLLGVAEEEPWGSVLRSSLPSLGVDRVLDRLGAPIEEHGLVDRGPHRADPAPFRALTTFGGQRR
jgi:D-alanyl-D-alanine carboxypeptidase